MLRRLTDPRPPRQILPERSPFIFHQLTGGVKNLKKIEMYEMDSGGYAMAGRNGYAQAGRWMANGSMEGEYGHNSFANRGQHWVNGHFSRDGNSMQGNSYGNSYNGYSQHGNAMHELEDLLRRVDGAEREELMRAMREMVR